MSQLPPPPPPGEGTPLAPPKGNSTRNWTIPVVIAVVIIIGLIVIAAQIRIADSPGTTNTGVADTDEPENTAPEDLSVAYRLAAIDGDIGKEAAFQDAIDCIMASGIEGAETEEQVGDTLVASWEASGKQSSLLEWAQVLCTA